MTSTNLLLLSSLAACVLGLASITGCSSSEGDDQGGVSGDALSGKEEAGAPAAKAKAAVGAEGGTCRNAVGSTPDCDTGLHCLVKIKFPTTANGTPVTTRTCVGPDVGTLGGACRDAVGSTPDCDTGLHCLVKIKFPTTANGTPVTTRTCTDVNACGSASCSGGAICCNATTGTCSDKAQVCPP